MVTTLSKIFTAIGLCFFVNSHAAIWFVSENGSGNMNGGSWANAAAGTSLQITIDGASNGDEIWIACGTYKPTNTNNRALSFHMKNNVSIFGSFAGTETSLSQRAFSYGPCSIISGEIGANGIYLVNVNGSSKVLNVEH